MPAKRDTDWVRAKSYTLTHSEMIELAVLQLTGNVQGILQYWAGGRGRMDPVVR